MEERKAWIKSRCESRLYVGEIVMHDGSIEEALRAASTETIIADGGSLSYMIGHKCFIS